MVEIRPESSGDAILVRAVHLAAFPTRLEADLVEQLHADGDAAISLVAIDDGELVGHVLLSRMSVEADGRALNALGLAPVAVIPQRQRQGVGSALIKAALSEAEAKGTEIIFVVGEPDYYWRFGFTAAAAEPFASPYEGPHLQAKTLGSNRRPASRGRADYALAFAECE